MCQRIKDDNEKMMCILVFLSFILTRDSWSFFRQSESYKSGCNCKEKSVTNTSIGRATSSNKMRAVFVILLLVAAVAAGNWNTFDFNNRNNLNVRDAKHQKFVLNLLKHLQNDLKNNDFLKYSQTIKIDNKNDYKVSYKNYF